MDTTQAIRTRRSVRKYMPGAVIPQEHIDLMLEAAMLAPSARNAKPWSFIVVQSTEARRQITEGTQSNWFLNDASLAIVVCGDPEALSGGPAGGFWQQGCAAATQNLLLQATELGYGTCWCGVFPGARTPVVTEVLDIQNAIPLSMVAIGVPNETPAPKSFYDKERVRYVR